VRLHIFLGLRDPCVKALAKVSLENFMKIRGEDFNLPRAHIMRAKSLKKGLLRVRLGRIPAQTPYTISTDNILCWNIEPL
jgi:hypothetical protein